jgi:hypothetical protein
MKTRNKLIVASLAVLFVGILCASLIKWRGFRDGEIHYIIENGIQLTGMPAMASPKGDSAAESWKLVSYIRSL